MSFRKKVKVRVSANYARLGLIRRVRGTLVKLLSGADHQFNVDPVSGLLHNEDEGSVSAAVADCERSGYSTSQPDRTAARPEPSRTSKIVGADTEQLVPRSAEFPVRPTVVTKPPSQ